ncbi:MAG TPA: response regulator transcription factor [Tepidisphaeraceae bacterium]|mgnify:CR=1 FL=1|nr:response regulator transcription factor [Tepidisphaeraceae bacterium]
MPATPANATVRSSGKNKTTVMLVDDHPIVRRGIAEVINAEADLSVCAEASTMQEAMAAASASRPNLVIVDVSLNGNNGIELMKNFNARWESLPILAYSMHDESIYAERALRAGAKGYVMKQSAPEALIEAIRAILKGKIYLSEAMSNRLLGKMVGAGGGAAVTASPIDKLSDRELEVLELLGQGSSTSQIADKLCLSVKTIETYREHLKQKLDLGNGQELLRYAIEWSLSKSS